MVVSSNRSQVRDNPAAGPPTAAVVKLDPAAPGISDLHNDLLNAPGQTIGSWIARLGVSKFGPLDLTQLDQNLRIRAIFKPRDIAKITAHRAVGGRGSKVFTVDEPAEYQTYIRFEIDPYEASAADSLASLEATLFATQAGGVVQAVSICGVLIDGGAILNGDEIEGVRFNSAMKQGFFDLPAIGGIGISYIQTKYPDIALGQGTWFADVEQGWWPPHSEINGKYDPDPLSGVNRDWIWSRAARAGVGDFAPFGWHGLTTLGLILAKPNGVGLTGIAPESFGFLSAEWEKLANSPYRENTAQAIKDAADMLDPGDVILIEGQQYFTQYGCNLPVEADPAIFAAIQYATSQDITVIEPVGNNFPSGVDLDAFMAPHPLRLFDQDSGAILVAAGNNNVANPAFSSRVESNFGSNVHCFADGDMIWSLDPPSRSGNSPNSYYLVPKGGTSTAAAIIAGVALVLQGIQRAQNTPKVISAAAMRALLSNPGNGRVLTPAGLYGVMPDLIKMEQTSGPLDSLGNLHI
jgi:hypothetical protein